MSFLKKSEITKKTEYKNGHFLYTANAYDIFKHTFDIYKKESKWVVDGTNYSDFGKENGIFDFPFKGDCDEYSKEKFSKLRKKGINKP